MIAAVDLNGFAEAHAAAQRLLTSDANCKAKLARRHRCHSVSWPVADRALVTAMYAIARTRTLSPEDC
ncbi:hypothetical protein L3V59_36005 [Burkholderia aenigmatica]|uniref:hypothetical protein n=1 Tax=Burkholderia aenigmatica TaxID=2015348 RepID=UPI001F20A77C|nr:hypothetical protein [Burkholderia aenigmatica]UKD17355.1 hypothetical protein L3V59_36005 [Burkholderia aenigmatica]